MSKTFIAPDSKAGCRWCGAAPEFLEYHDNEWGFPVDDDQRLFEKMCLESFQSGLSSIIRNYSCNYPDTHTTKNVSFT